MTRKKSIYDLSIKEMRSLLRDFSCTLYGRTVFFFAYFAPFMTFLVLIGLVIVSGIEQTTDYYYPIVGTFFLFIGLFLLGNIYYYNELRSYSEKRN